MESYKRYKWFYTSSGKLVVGGKNAEQNDEILKKMKNLGKDRMVFHTSHPGSPFCVIFSEIKKVTKKDILESAIFTGCFSRAWKQGKKKTEVHLFKLSQVEKKTEMKSGTWSVLGGVKKIKVPLRLYLTRQEGVYRAIPFSSSEKCVEICPGKINKEKMTEKLREALKDKKVSKEELLSALPAGGLRIC